MQNFIRYLDKKNRKEITKERKCKDMTDKIQQIIERFELTDASVGTYFYKLECTEEEKRIIITALLKIRSVEK